VENAPASAEEAPDTQKGDPRPPFSLLWRRFAPDQATGARDLKLGQGERERQGADAQGRGETESPVDDRHFAFSCLRGIISLRNCNIVRLVIFTNSKATTSVA